MDPDEAQLARSRTCAEAWGTEDKALLTLTGVEVMHIDYQLDSREVPHCQVFIDIHDRH